MAITYATMRIGVRAELPRNGDVIRLVSLMAQMMPTTDTTNGIMGRGTVKNRNGKVNQLKRAAKNGSG